MDIRITGKDCMEEMLRLQSRVKELEGAIDRHRKWRGFKVDVDMELYTHLAEPSADNDK